MKKKIAILGAGISGLSAAKFLKDRWKDQIELTLIEKQKRAGGWIKTRSISECLFEMGARSFRTKGKGRAILELVEALGLQTQVILPSKEANQRFIYTERGLKGVPTRLASIPFNALTRDFLKVLWRDWTAPKRSQKDESIASFFKRRIGEPWSETLIDALTIGVFAGDYRELSIKSCFPDFDRWEQSFGSLLKGALRKSPPLAEEFESQKSAFVQSVQQALIFSFREGMHTLSEALASDVKEHLLLGKEVCAIESKDSQIELSCADGEILRFDGVFSTLPAHALCLLKGLSPQLKSRLGELSFASVAIVNMGWKEDLLTQKGFGFLVPSKWKLPVLGCVFDSALFPQQNSSYHTRLGVMLGGSLHPEIIDASSLELLKMSQEIVCKELGIETPAAVFHVHRAKNAIAQFKVGFSDWREDVFKLMKQNHPHLFLGGSSFCGVSIGDCVSDAKKRAEEMGNLFFCKK